MNRRAFLLGSAAAIAAPAVGKIAIPAKFHTGGTVSPAVHLVGETSLEQFVTDRIAAGIRAYWVAEIETVAGHGITTYVDPAEERVKPAMEAIDELLAAGGEDLRGYQHLFAPVEIDTSVLTLENLREAMKKLKNTAKSREMRVWPSNHMPII